MLLVFVLLQIGFSCEEIEVQDLEPYIGDFTDSQLTELNFILINRNFSDLNLLKFPFLKEIVKKKRFDCDLDQKQEQFKGLWYYLKNIFNYDAGDSRIQWIDIEFICEYYVWECYKQKFLYYFDILKSYLSVQIFGVSLVELMYFLFFYYCENWLFRTFVSTKNEVTCEFIEYKASKVKTFIYFHTKLATLFLRLTLVYLIFETYFVITLSILFTIPHLIYNFFFWSVNSLLYYKKRKLKRKRQKSRIFGRPIKHSFSRVKCFRERGLTYESDLYDEILLKIFMSADDSDELVSLVLKNVVGSLYDFATHYRNMHAVRDNYYSLDVRSRAFSQWTNQQLQAINLTEEAKNLIEWKNKSNKQVLYSVGKIIAKLATYDKDNNNLNLTLGVDKSNSSFLQVIEEHSQSKKQTYCYDYFEKKMYYRYIYNCRDVKFDVVFLDADKQQIEAYSDGLDSTSSKAKLIKGDVIVRSSSSEILIEKLSKLNSDFNYVSKGTEIEHSYSHSISKVMHMTVINENLEVSTYNKILDIGASFCDIQLGNGVQYCIADLEEQDTRRCKNAFDRIHKYLSSKENFSSLTVYCGDVTKFNFLNTDITKFVLHNSCYNIDLVKLLDTATVSGVKTVINSAQITLNVLHGYDGESIDNEMIWRHEYTYNESILSESNCIVQGGVKVDLYPHKCSILIDWFKKCCVKINYDSGVKIWNSENVRATLGYYVCMWTLSLNAKSYGKLSNNDDYSDVLSVQDDLISHTVVVIPRHKYLASAEKILSIPRNIRAKPEIEEAATTRLSNRYKSKTKCFEIDADKDWDCLSRINCNDALIIRSQRTDLEQEMAEVYIAGEVDNLIKFNISYLNEFKCEWDLILNSLANSDYSNFLKFMDECETLGFKIQGQMYSLSGNVKDRYVEVSNNNMLFKNISSSVAKKIDYCKLYNLIQIEIYGTKYGKLDLQKIKLNHISVDELKKKIEEDEVYLNSMQLSNVKEIEKHVLYNNDVKKKEEDQEISEEEILGNGKKKKIKTKIIKERKYKIPPNLELFDEDIQQAKITGELKYNCVNSFVVLDCDLNEYYDPYGIVNENDGKITFVDTIERTVGGEDKRNVKIVPIIKLIINSNIYYVVDYGWLQSLKFLNLRRKEDNGALIF